MRYRSPLLQENHAAYLLRQGNSGWNEDARWARQYSTMDIPSAPHSTPIEETVIEGCYDYGEPSYQQEPALEDQYDRGTTPSSRMEIHEETEPIEPGYWPPDNYIHTPYGSVQVQFWEDPYYEDPYGIDDMLGGY